MRKIVFSALVVAAASFFYATRASTTNTIEFPVTDQSLIGVLKPDGKMGYFFMVDGQLTSSEVAETQCKAKLHACFKLNNAELNALLGGILSSRDCDNICTGIDTRACPHQACVDCCVVATGNGGATTTSCNYRMVT